ncbi:MAG: MFS transporter [Gluconacetobacter diazotrophicus]|nr:MFS transporter [Gluconacetobacter diazotrophicus]
MPRASGAAPASLQREGGGPVRSAVRSPLPRFVLLYGAMFSAFGMSAPFLPSLFKQDGLSPTAIGAVLAAGTAIRLLTGPLGGRLSDRSGRPPIVLAALSAAASVVALGYAPFHAFLPLLLVSVAHAALLAPMTPIADALALGSSEREGGFSYGTVRGAGSAAFVLGTLLAGQAVARLGLGAFVFGTAALLFVAGCAAPFLPNRVSGREAAGAADRDGAGSGRRGSIAALLRVPGFARLMLVAALVLGSHALHDGFSVIRWRSAGLSATETSVVWSLSVASEVAVFTLFGRRILDRIGPARSLMVSAAAGTVRWTVSALTAAFPVIAVSECLHGLSFALLHLAVMRLIAATVPAELAATAQSVYATAAVGAVTALVTLASGPAYGYLGPDSFLVMAAMCAAALPVATGLRAADVPESRPGAA